MIKKSNYASPSVRAVEFKNDLLVVTSQFEGDNEGMGEKTGYGYDDEN